MEARNTNCDIKPVHVLMQSEEYIPATDAHVQEEILLQRLVAAVNRGECSMEEAEVFLYEARMAGHMAIELSQSA